VSQNRTALEWLESDFNAAENNLEVDAKGGNENAGRPPMTAARLAKTNYLLSRRI
jgi:hypothetical protein